MSRKGNRITGLSAAGMLVAIGIVFGDIGTSPLYVMKAILNVSPEINRDYIIGAVSCVIWTLTLQTTIKYVTVALRADNNGEGGILALFSLVKKTGTSGWPFIVAAIGASAMLADGIITPAVTVHIGSGRLAFIICADSGGANCAGDYNSVVLSAAFGSD